MKKFVMMVLAVGISYAATINIGRYSFDPLVKIPSIPDNLKYEYSNYYLVQFKGPIYKSQRDALENLGVRIYGYIPYHAYLVKMDDRIVRKVYELGFISWIGTYHPAYKIHPMLGKIEFYTPERKNDPWMLVSVELFPDADNDVVTEHIREKFNADIKYHGKTRYNNRIKFRIDPQYVDDIVRIPQVMEIEEVPEYFLFNNAGRFVIQTNNFTDTTSGDTLVWSKGIHGEGEILTMMDTGIDTAHCFFNGTVNGQKKWVKYEVVGGGTFYDSCDMGHGSHVAGTAVGGTDELSQNLQYKGMAYKARLHVQDIQTGSTWDCTIGSVYPPDPLTSAFDTSYAIGARVHTNSWGSTTNSYDQRCADVDNFIWNHPDYVILYAAGNSSTQGSSEDGTVGQPANAKNDITMGATARGLRGPGGPNNYQEIKAWYSSEGPTADGRMEPNVMAPGGDDRLTAGYIHSTDNWTTCGIQGNPFMGTSMATPHGAGAVLLVRQYYREGWYPTGAPDPGNSLNPSAALVKATLVSGADSMTGTGDPNPVDYTWPNNNQGWGRINLSRSLYFTGDVNRLLARDITPGLNTGETYEETVYVYSGTPVRFVLAWSDYPGTPGSSPVLVNDLNLMVMNPNGTNYRGNNISNYNSQPGGSFDNLNNIEVVNFTDPVEGQYVITISGQDIPQGPQPFALVVNGNIEAVGVKEEYYPYSKVQTKLYSVRYLPSTGEYKFSYTLSKNMDVSVKLVDITGREVRTLARGDQKKGFYKISFSPRDKYGKKLSPGNYFVVLRTDKRTFSQKFVIAK